MKDNTKGQADKEEGDAVEEDRHVAETMNGEERSEQSNTANSKGRGSWIRWNVAKEKTLVAYPLWTFLR